MHFGNTREPVVYHLQCIITALAILLDIQPGCHLRPSMRESSEVGLLLLLLPANVENNNERTP